MQLAPAVSKIQYTINVTASSDVAINKTGVYTIAATDVNGCPKIFYMHVGKQNCADCDAYVPNAFTPDKDGLNDVFEAKLNCSLLLFVVKYLTDGVPGCLKVPMFIKAGMVRIVASNCCEALMYI